MYRYTYIYINTHIPSTVCTDRGVARCVCMYAGHKVFFFPCKEHTCTLPGPSPTCFASFVSCLCLSFAHRQCPDWISERKKKRHGREVNLFALTYILRTVLTLTTGTSGAPSIPSRQPLSPVLPPSRRKVMILNPACESLPESCLMLESLNL